jgi:pilus assembly protein FimV
LLRANPDAFLGDDINRLRRGSVLRVPGRDELGSVSADEAGQVVRQQMQQWRQARRPVRQPEVATAGCPSGHAGAGHGCPRRSCGAQGDRHHGQAETAAATPPRQAAPARRQEARLQIIPPAAPGKATGTRSGTTAGGEGSMLQQQLRQKDEDIAAKAVEIGELKERVAELEKLKQDQQQAAVAQGQRTGRRPAAPGRSEQGRRHRGRCCRVKPGRCRSRPRPQASQQVPADPGRSR